MFSWLKPNGIIFITTPNTASEAYARADSAIFDPRDHLTLYNPDSLARLLAEAGFREVVVRQTGGGAHNDNQLMAFARR